MRPRPRLDDHPRRRASRMRGPVASLTGSISPTTPQPTTPQFNASDPPWRLRNTPWRSARASCALSPATPPAPMPPSRSRPTRRGRTTWFGQRTAGWPPVRWLSHCEWHLRPAGATLTSAAAEEPGVPPTSASHVSRHPTWPGAAPGPALRSTVHPGPAQTIRQEPAQQMLLGFRRGVSSFAPKPRMLVRLPPESKPLSKLRRIFLAKNSGIWQESPRAR